MTLTQTLTPSISFYPADAGGGAKVIYYWITADEQIYMLYAYPKNEQEDLTAAQKKRLKQVVERWLNEEDRL